MHDVRNDAALFPTLGGCKLSLNMPTREHMDAAIAALTHCEQHHGQHHFAVTGEGMTLSVSSSGYGCVSGTELFAGVLPELEPA